MKFFWTVPILTAYIYAITVLAQFGFNNYFGIPYNFTDSSIAVITIYTFSLARLLAAMGSLLFFTWWFWAGVIIVAAIVVFHNFWKGYVYIATPPRGLIKWVAFIAALIFLWGSESYGGYLASTQTSYFVLSDTCSQDLDAGLTYVVPNFYAGSAIVVPINSDKKVIGKFFLKDTTNCVLEKKEIGRILQ